MFFNWFKNKSSKDNITPEMKYLVVGLGNVGPEYYNTRHNVGFRVLDSLAESKEKEFSVKSQGSLAEIKHKGRSIYLLKPSTFMNLSGKSVRYWMDKLSVNRSNLLIVVDDIALPFGKQRLRPSGSDGGHNGLKSIDATLATNAYARLRIGIGSEFHTGQQVSYVLGEWDKDQEMELETVLKYASDTILSFCSIGLQHTMNAFNKK